MKVKEEQYNWLAEQVYWVDKLKTDKDYTPEVNKTYPLNPKKRDLGNFKVVEVKDNTSNGMQAMAVVPINKVTGQVDHRYKYDVIGNVVGNEKKKLFMLYYKAIIG